MRSRNHQNRPKARAPPAEPTISPPYRSAVRSRNFRHTEIGFRRRRSIHYPFPSSGHHPKKFLPATPNPVAISIRSLREDLCVPENRGTRRWFLADRRHDRSVTQRDTVSRVRRRKTGGKRIGQWTNHRRECWE
ncbi:hypothetical protein HPP92_015617 [Vanilla planifolia]|uniref:Uncharacterized protein n=1 Tax=Vanilla planifolia TaxID=51239 RepID=A0A835UTF5_VANPL|nr:hypothetical protein HPP92_015617 [Vanilla planifolia]